MSNSTDHAFQEYTPIQYLKIDIATNYGNTLINGVMVDLDKVNFEDRIDWFDTQKVNGTLVSAIKDADNPALYFAGLTAYESTLNGEAIGYPISLDACSSGLQLLSVMSGCEKSALRCGLINTGKREDAYTSLFQDMCDTAEGKIPLRATRPDMKQAIMTSLYGSTAQPKYLFGENSPALELFYKTMEENIPGAWALNIALKGLWQPYALTHEWEVPDGFQVSMKVESLETDSVMFLGEELDIFTKQAKGTAKGLSLSPNIVHSIDGMVVREITRRCNYDPQQVKSVLEICEMALKRGTQRKSAKGRGRKKDVILRRVWARYMKSGFLSARVIDLIDEANIGLVSAAYVKRMILTLPAKPFSVLSIHDCFRVLPCYGNDLRRQYNLILSELASSVVLDDIATQITGQRQRLNKLGSIAHKIPTANYALS